MIPKMDIALNDFSGGEFDSDAKRMNGPEAMTGGRTVSNWCILNSRKLKNRPGRRAILLESGRVDKVLMAPGRKFKLVFRQGALRVYDSATNAQVFSHAGFAWTEATAKNVVWCQHQLSIYIFFAGQIPQVLSWDGVATWTVVPYSEAVTRGGQKRTFFYRISPHDITLKPSTLTGDITLEASDDLFVAGWAGTRIRWANRQIQITGIIDARNANATVIESLPGTQNVHFGSTVSSIFNVGDLVEGSVSGARGIIVAVPNSAELNIQLLSTGTTTSASFSAPPTAGGFVATSAFVNTDIISGAAGSLQVNAIGGIAAPSAISIWDEEVMNAFRGWPASGTFDQNRLVMCNFPAVPSGIGWSAIGLPNDLYVDGTTSQAIFEVAPNKSQVLYVQPGAEGSEFLFCDNRVYYIPISINNPLKPGSVVFGQISGDGCYPVQPRPAGTAMLFLAAGGKRVSAIVAIGATNRPYDIADLTELHSHLINSPVAIAIPTADGASTERYAYVVNGDGTVAVGKYTLDEQQQIRGKVGWIAWSNPVGAVKWIGALEEDVIFTTTYHPAGIPSLSVAEQLDASLFLDCAMFVNAVPASLVGPAGSGPFWWMPGTSIQLMDQATRPLGTYAVDVDGNIVPQGSGGEDLAAASLVGGFGWTSTYEPFIPHAPPGQDSQQRMRKRKIVKAAVSFQQSSGFTFGNRIVPAYNLSDDVTLPPPPREGTEPFRSRGRDYDPRIQLVKDTPGPLIITELGLEVTV